MGQRICTFGWAPNSPLRDLIESAGIDGWIEGPGFGGGIDLQQLADLTSIMQAMRKHQQQYGAGLSLLNELDGVYCRICLAAVWHRFESSK